MFEGFPYTNFHELNLDWIIKIAKDFLDQYSNIQQTITQGLEDLDTKAQQLQALLDAWYDEHSQDIANQLAEALQDLNTWYTEHVGYLDQELQDNITAFQAAATAAAAAAIETIPEDYTDLTKRVSYLNNYVGNSLIEYVYGLGGWTSNTGFSRVNNYGVCICLKDKPEGRIIFNSPKNILIYDSALAWVETLNDVKTYYPAATHKYIIIFEGTFGTTVTEAQAIAWLGNMSVTTAANYIPVNNSGNNVIKAILGLGTYMSNAHWFNSAENPYALGIELNPNEPGIIAFSDPKTFLLYNADGSYSRSVTGETFVIPTGSETLVVLYDSTKTFGYEYNSEEMFAWLDDMRILKNEFTNIIIPQAIPAYVNSNFEFVYTGADYGYWVTHIFHLKKDDILHLDIKYQAPVYPVFCKMENGVITSQLLATSQYGALNTYYHAKEDMTVCACACTYTSGVEYAPPVYTLNGSRPETYFSGKEITFIGDSYIANNGKLTSYTWWKKISDKLGMNPTNLGINGDGLVGIRGGLTPVKDRLNDIPATADIIMVVGGENDANISLDIDTFKSGIQDIITNIYNAHPGADLIFCTPWGDGWNSRTFIKPYADAIKEICQLNGVRYFDGWNTYVYSRSTVARQRYYQATNDGSHLNNTGHDIMANMMLKFLV